MFTWSTDDSWSGKTVRPYTFTDGVRGSCLNVIQDGATRVMAFKLNEGPACTFHFKCSILDKDDKVLRVTSEPWHCDFQKPPLELLSNGRGVVVDLTEADKAKAGRKDGSIKLRMVVHLYLP